MQQFRCLHTYNHTNKKKQDTVHIQNVVTITYSITPKNLHISHGREKDDTQHTIITIFI